MAHVRYSEISIYATWRVSCSLFIYQRLFISDNIHSLWGVSQIIINDRLWFLIGTLQLIIKSTPTQQPPKEKLTRSFIPVRVRSCDSSTFIRCTPILIWSFSKESAIWSILIWNNLTWLKMMEESYVCLGRKEIWVSGSFRPFFKIFEIFKKFWKTV